MTKRHYVISLLVVFLVLGAGSALRAQTTQPELLLTWEAQTYTPAQFPGRNLPAANSQVSLALDVVVNGRSIDLSPYTINWQANGRRFASGRGLGRTTITTPEVLGRGEITVRAQVQGINNQSPAKTATIPIVSPRVEIKEAKQTGNTRVFQALPYFFNVNNISQLLFDWTVSGASPSSVENPQRLEVTLNNALPKGTIVPINLQITNSGNNREQAFAGVQITNR